MGDRDEEEVKSDQALDALARANPVPPESVRGAAEGARAQQTLRRITGEREPGKDGRPSAILRRSWLTQGVAAAIVLLTAIFAIVLPRDSQLEQALADVAAVARHQRLPTPAPGRFLYIKSVTTDPVSASKGGATWTALVPKTIERWIGSDGSGRVRTVPGRPRFLTSGDRLSWLEAGRPPLAGAPSRRDFPPGHFTDEGIRSLPTDPMELFQILSARARSQGAAQDSEIFTTVGDLLRNPFAPPELRFALYQAAAHIPGIELVGTMMDPIGREGVAVGITTRASGFLERWTLVFDPTTSEVLAERRILLEPRAPTIVKAPVTIQTRVEITRREVASLGDRSETDDQDG